MANTVVTTLAPTLNAITASTSTAAVADTIDLAEIFDITICKDGKSFIEIANVSAANGTVTFSLAAGAMWGSTVALTGSITQGLTKIIQVDSAKFKAANGVMALTVTPASGKKLKTDHALTVRAVALV